ncbi:glycosyltransferase family 4 protein [Pseudomonas asiatica]|uniref:Glycosyltransferase family 4 protein n=1 Tax=Pseudomonas asiatica TaxID=2219225 RepID=A0A9X4HXE7_9PSED|nr:glycosyltransferase family 4 protein [Pseudomonas asiatica]MDD2109867.1 glycosyltransferase family 4 protein [Pseudomonas asiatica]
MKVLVWSQYYWPENFHINDVVMELARQQVEVTVVTGKPNYPEGRIFSGYTIGGVKVENHGEVEVIRLPLLPRGQNSAIKLLLNYLSFIVMGYMLAPWLLRGRRFDAVFVYAPSPLFQALPALWVAGLKRAPLLLWVQDLWPESLRATGFVKNKWLLKAVEFAVTRVYRGADRILIQSEAFRPSVTRLLGLGCAARISYFPNSAAEAQRPSPYCVESAISQAVGACFSVVFAGNIGYAQSCDTIIEAAQLLRGQAGIRFFIVGSGSQAEHMAQRVSVLGLKNVELVGRVPPSQMGAIYAASSVLLLTLRDDPVLSVTVPSKFQSYLAAGKPVIASCNGEVARLVAESGCGLAVSAEDPCQLAKAVLELYQAGSDQLEGMGCCGKEFFSHNYMLADNVKKLIGFFAKTEH